MPSTGRLLSTGRAADLLDVPGVGAIRASMVDAANACVFVAAEALGLSGIELPDALDADAAVLRKLADIRLHASVAMGIAPDVAAARATPLVPLIGFVAAPCDSRTLDGEQVLAGDCDLVVRMISNGQPHRALPLTGSLCTAVAAQIEGSVVHGVARAGRDGPLRLAMPSGVLTVDARVRAEAGRWHAEHGSFFRTTRRLFDGFVHV